MSDTVDSLGKAPKGTGTTARAPRRREGAKPIQPSQPSETLEEHHPPGEEEGHKRQPRKKEEDEGLAGKKGPGGIVDTEV